VYKRFMVFFRQVMNFMVAGALLGILAVSLLGPSFIQWDNSGGTGADPRCLCGETARRGADRIIAYQMNGGAGGAVVGAIIGTLFAARRKKKAAAPGQT
jgi:hypothetical protein